MSLETLLFLRQILGNVTLQVGAPDFLQAANQVTAALAELDEAIGAAQGDTPAPAEPS